MAFKKGSDWNGNRKGRPPSPELECIRQAMATVEKSKKKKFWVHAFERAYADDSVLSTMIRKLLPDNINLAGHDGEALNINVVNYGTNAPT